MMECNLLVLAGYYRAVSPAFPLARRSWNWRRGIPRKLTNTLLTSCYLTRSAIFFPKFQKKNQVPRTEHVTYQSDQVNIHQLDHEVHVYPF